MGTNQWKWDFIGGDEVIDFNVDGSTALSHGVRLFAESRGYTVTENYTQKIDTLYAGGFSVSDFQDEIDAGCPVMIQVDGHTMVGTGYDTAGSTMYLHDTWDNSVHSMTWGTSYAGMDHQAMTVIHLAPAASEPVPEPTGLGIVGIITVALYVRNRRQTPKLCRGRHGRNKTYSTTGSSAGRS